MKSLQIVVPMAGLGSRFAVAGYTFPKPLISVGGDKPMIQVVVENLGLRGDYRFLARADHADRYALRTLLRLVTQPFGSCTVITVDSTTGGQAESVLLALPEGTQNEDCPVIVANADQFLDGWHPAAFMDFIRRDDPDGAILTFHGSHPKWSFAQVEPEGNRVLRVAEKDPISTRACCGVFYFKTVGLLRGAVLAMMLDDANRVNGEWYLAPVYNLLIARGSRVIEYPVPRMLGLGTPEDLERFERLLDDGKVKA